MTHHQLKAENDALRAEIKTLRFLLERARSIRKVQRTMRLEATRAKAKRECSAKQMDLLNGE
jgi:hypothetical protein